MALETPYVNMILYFLTYQDTYLRNRFITSKPTNSGRSHLHLHAFWLGRWCPLATWAMAGLGWTMLWSIWTMLWSSWSMAIWSVTITYSAYCLLNFLIPQCPSVVLFQKKKKSICSYSTNNSVHLLHQARSYVFLGHQELEKPVLVVQLHVH